MDFKAVLELTGTNLSFETAEGEISPILTNPLMTLITPRKNNNKNKRKRSKAPQSTPRTQPTKKPKTQTSYFEFLMIFA